MDKSIEQLGQDLARANYSKTTRKRYVGTALELAQHCRKALVDVTREDVRAFVEFEQSRGLSPSQLSHRLCAVLFLFRRTLGRPELVSFIKLPRRYSPLPSVLSLEEVNVLLRTLRHRRYQAIAMVMYGAGLRISEAIALEVRDIDGSRGVLQVRQARATRPAKPSSRPRSTSGSGNTGRARGRRFPICSRPGRPASCRARPPCERLWPAQRRRHGSRSPSGLTFYATRSPPTYSTRAPTCTWCASCWGTRASRQRLVTHA